MTYAELHTEYHHGILTIFLVYVRTFIACWLALTHARTHAASTTYNTASEHHPRRAGASAAGSINDSLFLL